MRGYGSASVISPLVQWPVLNKNLLALAGEYHVASQLCLKGYVASLTLKNYPGVDIFCLNPANGRQAAVQVKTTRSNAYYVPEKYPEGNCPFVFVHVVRPGQGLRRMCYQGRTWPKSVSGRGRSSLPTILTPSPTNRG